MEKATRQQTKHHNTRLVLRNIFNAAAISRADIARQTGLTRPTVSTIVADLLDENLIIDIGTGQSAGGKPPNLLEINQHGRHLIAVSLSGQEFRGARVNLKGEVETVSSLPVDESQGKEALELVFQLIENLRDTSTVPLLGLGVATPGMVDAQNGIVLRAVNLGWNNLPLRDLLHDRFQLPVYVANDSHMAALAEFTYGLNRHSSNLIVLTIDQGIGSGIVLKGQLFYGDGYGAGEIGHVVVQPGGELCACGNRGCLETTSSIRAILRHATTAATETTTTQLKKHTPITWSHFVAAVNNHDPVAINIATQAGRQIGVAIANLIGASNIHNIVITGQIAELGDALLNPIISEMHQRVLPALAATTRIHYTSLTGDKAEHNLILGCSALILQQELGVL